MRRFRMKVAVLVIAGAILPAFLLKCDKAALNLQRGFWQGLGDNLAGLVIPEAQQAGG